MLTKGVLRMVAVATLALVVGIVINALFKDSSLVDNDLMRSPSSIDLGGKESAKKPNVVKVVDKVDNLQVVDSEVENPSLDQKVMPDHHDHRDCMAAIQRAMDTGAYDSEAPELTEQEKYDLIANHPQLGEMLERYEMYMYDENGDEVLRSDLAENFEREIAELQAKNGEVERVSFDNL